MEIDDAARVAALEKDWRSVALSPRESALCTWAEKLTLRPADMSAADLEPLRAAGLDDAAILDLAQVVSYFNYINRIADGLGVDLEDFMTTPAGEDERQ